VGDDELERILEGSRRGLILRHCPGIFMGD
jgi:hypothetical protein